MPPFKNLRYGEYYISPRNISAGKNRGGPKKVCRYRPARVLKKLARKKKPGYRSSRAWQCVLCCCENRAFARPARAAQAAACTAGIAPKLLTAAHTYSLNWSRITSTSAEQRRRTGGAQGHAQPTRGTSRVTVGRGREARFTSRDWDAGLSLSLYCPPPGSFSRTRLSRNAGDRQGIHRRHPNPVRPFGRSELHPYYV